MDIYFGKPSDNKIILDEDESNHLINVKRVRIGDLVHVTDGEGNIYLTELLNLEKRSCTLGIRETKRANKNPFHLHIALAPTKNIERVEWFLEKATETGIDEISFLQCRHSERKEIKTERLNRVVVAAIKQSIKPFLPKLNPMVDFKTFISGNFSGTKLICTMHVEKIEDLKKNYLPGNNLTVLIGPEGDFHREELNLAIEYGFKPTLLGPSRLRTETAAMTVCTLFNFMNEI